MAGKMTRDAYEKLIAQNLDWLGKQPRTLEREHIIEIVKASPGHEYDLRAQLSTALAENDSLAAQLAEVRGLLIMRRKK